MGRKRPPAAGCVGSIENLPLPQVQMSLMCRRRRPSSVGFHGPPAAGVRLRSPLAPSSVASRPDRAHRQAKLSREEVKKNIRLPCEDIFFATLDSKPRGAQGRDEATDRSRESGISPPPPCSRGGSEQEGRSGVMERLDFLLILCSEKNQPRFSQNRGWIGSSYRRVLRNLVRRFYLKSPSKSRRTLRPPELP